MGLGIPQIPASLEARLLVYGIMYPIYPSIYAIYLFTFSLVYGTLFSSDILFYGIWFFVGPLVHEVRFSHGSLNLWKWVFHMFPGLYNQSFQHSLDRGEWFSMNSRVYIIVFFTCVWYPTFWQSIRTPSHENVFILWRCGIHLIVSDFGCA